MDLNAYASLDLELEQGWLTVWFNEPERKNPLTGERVKDLLSLAQNLEERKDIRGVVIRGRGGVFCAGGDLKAFQAAFAGGDVRDDVIALSREAAQVFDAIDKLPQFTVMVVEGAAMAGGMGITCCGDYVIATPDTKFALTEIRLGIVAAQIAPYVLRRLGVRNTRKLMLRGASIRGEEAFEAGLADFIADSDAKIEEALAAIRADLLKASPNAVAVTKKLVAEIEALPREEQINRAARDFADCLLSDDGKEGVSSFIQKRKPSWAEVEDV